MIRRHHDDSSQGSLYDIEISFAAPDSKSKMEPKRHWWKNIRNLAFVILDEARVPNKTRPEKNWSLKATRRSLELNPSDDPEGKTAGMKSIPCLVLSSCCGMKGSINLRSQNATSNMQEAFSKSQIAIHGIPICFPTTEERLHFAHDPAEQHVTPKQH
ncbi:hypothetical protein IV203_030263 [Nitzschia inconspicua]|uniref:Uncharacterized protein n=1 Tax=Nitzschia inconspicua TaxID=303405 RepID=A0A9K3LSU8_9STRA|nr:hypothetical protein IV203_030263 [Nitzschia inconspicua]